MSMVNPIRRGGLPRRARVASLVAGAAAAVLLGAGTATAAPPAPLQEPDCFPSSLCLWDETGFTGERFNVSSLDPAGTCVSLVDHGWGDRARSVANTHGQSAAMFMNDDCIGDPFQVPPNSSRADLGGFTPRSVWVPQN